jgi:hypothetical protein
MFFPDIVWFVCTNVFLTKNRRWWSHFNLFLLQQLSSSFQNIWFAVHWRSSLFFPFRLIHVIGEEKEKGNKGHGLGFLICHRRLGVCNALFYYRKKKFSERLSVRQYSMTIAGKLFEALMSVGGLRFLSFNRLGFPRTVLEICVGKFILMERMDAPLNTRMMLTILFPALKTVLSQRQLNSMFFIGLISY